MKKNHIQFPLDDIDSNTDSMSPQLGNIRTLTTFAGKDTPRGGGIIFNYPASTGSDVRVD